MALVAPRHDQFSLRLPARAESVGIGRRAATQFAEEVGCDAPTLWRVRLSVSEALSNVVLHAYGPGDEQPHVALLAEADDAGVHITVADEGSGLRARNDSPGMGLGLSLSANACDALALDGGRSGGTVVRMTFSR